MNISRRSFVKNILLAPLNARNGLEYASEFLSVRRNSDSRSYELEFVEGSSDYALRDSTDYVVLEEDGIPSYQPVDAIVGGLLHNSPVDMVEKLQFGSLEELLEVVSYGLENNVSPKPVRFESSHEWYLVEGDNEKIIPEERYL